MTKPTKKQKEQAETVAKAMARQYGIDWEHDGKEKHSVTVEGRKPKTIKHRKKNG